MQLTLKMFPETSTGRTPSRFAALQGNLLPLLLLGVICFVVGVAVDKMPNLAWSLVGLAVGIALLELPPATWVIAAVSAACLLRVAVWLGMPAFLGFVHFPLVLGAVLTSTLKTSRLDALAKKLRIGLVLLLLISILSTLLNGGEPLRPFVDWLVFLEPFLLLFALIASPPGAKATKFLWRIILTISALQLPLGVYQLIVYANHNPDLVQGTFVGQGAGAHVAGAVSLTGVFLCIARAAYRPMAKMLPWYLIAAALMFLLPVLADAKQAIVCFLPGLMVLIVLSGRMSLGRLLAPTAVGTLLLSLAYIYYPPLQFVSNTDLISSGLSAKMIGVRDVVRHLNNAPGGWLIGLGPGNSISRVAMLTSGGIVKEDSPVARLGLKLAPTTREMLYVNNKNYLSSASSVWSTISSWLGLLGDLGILGLLTYLWICTSVWKALSQRNTWETAAARGTMIMAGLLALFFSWLEEPGFTLLLAAVIGLAILDITRESSLGGREFSEVMR